MKKIIVTFSMLMLFLSCGKYKELNKEEKYSLLYKAEILQKKDARKEVNKIYKSLDKYIAKNDDKALKEKEQYEDIVYFLKNVSRNYRTNTIGWNIFDDKSIKYPSLEEVIGKGEEPVNAQFRLYLDNRIIYDYLTDKPFTGTAIYRLGNGNITEVVSIKDGKTDGYIQKNRYNGEGTLIREEYFDENKKMKGYKKYTSQKALVEELYVLERYPNGEVKRDYIRINGSEKGKLRLYNSKKVIISQEEK